ncbi:MAG: shikimate kinase [Peptococcaceae bacterium]|nr:shikimate kinase [Peptococcaceae bacterium]
MRSLILIGFMGTGKSTLGRVLAERLHLEQVDLDEVVVQEQNMPISDIFARYGEERFRELEHDVVRRYAAQPNLIISPGGGAVLREENRKVMREYCTVISLLARPEVILERVNRDETVRPVLENRKPGQSKLERIEEVLAQRMPCYQEADFILDTSDAPVELLAEQVLAWLNQQAGE